MCLFLTDGYVSAPGSFIYSLRNSDGIASFKSTLKNENDPKAIYRLSSYGPTFGYGHDLHIANNAGSPSYSVTYFGWSYTDFGTSYNLPLGYNTQSLLAGSFHFTPSEVEVLYLN